MKLEDWLRENDKTIDWEIFASPWDSMQRRHNPFRDDQIDSILHASGILEHDAPVVLDLGCGPGVLGRRIIEARPGAHYYGADGDPLMLAAMQRLVAGTNVHTLRMDLRTLGWGLQHQNQFDAVISLTALHWLTMKHLRQLYAIVLTVLKPGGGFVVGDPYLPEDPTERKRLTAFQQERMEAEIGPTWSEYWKKLYERYPIEAMYLDYHTAAGYGHPCAGSDDGYPLAFHMTSLRDVGFERASVYWMSGLRAVYGGTKAS